MAKHFMNALPFNLLRQKSNLPGQSVRNEQRMYLGHKAGSLCSQYPHFCRDHTSPLTCTGVTMLRLVELFLNTLTRGSSCQSEPERSKTSVSHIIIKLQNKSRSVAVSSRKTMQVYKGWFRKMKACSGLSHLLQSQHVVGHQVILQCASQKHHGHVLWSFDVVWHALPRFII